MGSAQVGGTMHLSLIETISAIATLGSAFLIEFLIFVALGLI